MRDSTVYYRIQYLVTNQKVGGVQCLVLQSNPSNPDTLGPIKSALISGVGMYRTAKTVLYIEVSLFQSVLIEGFHCISNILY